MNRFMLWDLESLPGSAVVPVLNASTAGCAVDIERSSPPPHRLPFFHVAVRHTVLQGQQGGQ